MAAGGADARTDFYAGLRPPKDNAPKDNKSPQPQGPENPEPDLAPLEQ